MKREEALAGIAYLVAATAGWTDEAVTLYVSEAQNYHDPNAFLESCKNLAKRWKENRRPFMYDINVAYQEVLRQRQMDMALPSGEGSGRIVSFEEGIKIATEAYESECKRLGKEPDRAIFEKWLPTTGP